VENLAKKELYFSQTENELRLSFGQLSINQIDTWIKVKYREIRILEEVRMYKQSQTKGVGDVSKSIG
jgi:hypothetical protein